MRPLLNMDGLNTFSNQKLKIFYLFQEFHQSAEESLSLGHGTLPGTIAAIQNISGIPRNKSSFQRS